MITTIDNLAISLLSKPFTVLYGPSGTGKTRAAIDLAELINNNYTQQWFPITVSRTGSLLTGNSGDYLNMVTNNEGNSFIIRLNDETTPASVEFCGDINITDSNVAPTFLSQDRNNLEIAIAPPLNTPCYKIISVGSNWNDNKQLLGYINPFGPANQSVYVLTPFIELLIMANHPDTEDIPFFCILDEMNLSHVEYYLSDILSAMEINIDNNFLISHENLLLIQRTLSTETSEYYTFLKQSVDNLISNHSGLPYTNNFYMIGTINIDETTQMLSNKVLDRAHLIKVESDKPSISIENTNFNTTFNSNQVLEKFKSITEFKNSQNIQTTFMESYSTAITSAPTTPREDQQWLLELLDGIYSILSTIDQDFGYRTTKEVTIYLTVGLKYLEDSTKLDKLVNNALNQKVFAKLSGNRRTLDSAIDQLVRTLNVYTTNTQEPYFKDTLKRLNDLQNKLRIRGHASFIS